MRIVSHPRRLSSVETRLCRGGSFDEDIKLVDAYVKAIETTEVLARLDKLEKRL